MRAVFAGKTVAMQNFLTDSQMAMGARVANTHKSEDTVPEQDRTSCSSVAFQGEGHSHLGEGISQAAGLAQGSANAQSDDQDVQVLPDVVSAHCR